MKYVPPGQFGSIVTVAPRYENFIGGKWQEPTRGEYRTDVSPASAGAITEVTQSTPEDIELALDAAHATDASTTPATRGAGDCRRVTGVRRSRHHRAGRPDGAGGTFDSAGRVRVRRRWM